MTLQQRFYNLLSQYTKNSVLIAEFWNTIVANYSEKHRAYHNLKHLEEIFTYFDTHKAAIAKPNLLSFSIFYHDIIYNIWRKDNEEKSADFAVQELGNIDLSIEELSIIKQQIIATKTHEAIDNDTQLFIDFDLAILGRPAKVYQQYTALIRQEYKSVPWFLYKKGRKKVLQHFLEKPSIYNTTIFKKLYENQAKENLNLELNSLK